MSAVLRCSSNSRLLALIALLGTSVLGGCTQTTANVFAGQGLFAAKKPVAQTEQAAVATDEVRVGAIDAAASNADKPALTFRDPKNSSWCRYMQNNAAAEAEIIASPTLSANSDDAGNGTLNIGMNLLDFKKAELVRQSADAKCQAYSAGKVLEAALRLSDESTKLASDLARQNYIENRQGEVESVVARAKALTNGGVLTVQQANTISQLRHDLLAEMNTARAEVGKRRNLPSIEEVELQGQNAALYGATSQLQAIDRQIRTIDAFDVSVQAGYRFNEGDELFAKQDDVYAKVKVGIRLGAVSPRRAQYEQAAAEARLAALNEEGSGPVWKTGFAREAIENTLAGLGKAKISLQAAKANADDTAGKLNASERQELVFAALQAKITSIKVGADLAAIEASISELEKNRGKLGALAN